MPNFAILTGNQVANIIVADDKEAAEQELGCALIEYTADNPAEVGWFYDEQTGRFTEPPKPVDE